jgi:hypothetical protein
LQLRAKFRCLNVYRKHGAHRRYDQPAEKLPKKSIKLDLHRSYLLSKNVESLFAKENIRAALRKT